jgi:hypothetical protein
LERFTSFIFQEDGAAARVFAEVRPPVGDHQRLERSTAISEPEGQVLKLRIFLSDPVSALLRLRVVHTNRHWDEYQEYRILREQRALYGADAHQALAA